MRRTPEWDKWFVRLRDQQARARIVARLERVQLTGNFGDYKDLGGVFELKITWGPGYRVYYARIGDEIVLLVGGGDKSTQSADIEKARLVAREWNERFDDD
ncbi:MAG: type II toxin-antitoxin system RelE/ParE family toxin [Propionibacteriaceae bacterium]|nr:type II toxin-antitoxin system RelE/ParE family toxin [Propionibacteriaceae bacterium]